MIKADIEPVNMKTTTLDLVDRTDRDVKTEPENKTSIVRVDQTPKSDPIAEANGISSVVKAGPIVNSEADPTNAPDRVPVQVVAQPEVVRPEPRLSMIQLLNDPESEELLIK